MTNCIKYKMTLKSELTINDFIIFILKNVAAQDRHLMWKWEHYNGFFFSATKARCMCVHVWVHVCACVGACVCMRVCIAITMGEVTFATGSSSLTIYR